MIVTARLPYSVVYRTRRSRTDKESVVWGDFSLTIDAPEAADAPVAFRLPYNDYVRRKCEVRSFAGHYWWPALCYDLDHEPQTESAEGFLAQIRAGGPSAVQHLAVGRNSSAPKQSYEGFFEGAPGHKVYAATKEQVHMEAQRAAALLMMCDGHLYVSGGVPVYYGLPDRSSRNEMNLNIGCSPGHALACYGVPGVDRNDRFRAFLRGRVFDIRSVDRDYELWKDAGWRSYICSSVDTVGDLTFPDTALALSAHGVLYALSTDKLRGRGFLDKIPDLSFLEAGDDPMPLAYSLPLLEEVTDAYASGPAVAALHETMICALNVLTRSDEEPSAAFTAEDEDIIAGLT